jgi:hypothetical protein
MTAHREDRQQTARSLAVRIPGIVLGVEMAAQLAGGKMQVGRPSPKRKQGRRSL